MSLVPVAIEKFTQMHRDLDELARDRSRAALDAAGVQIEVPSGGELQASLDVHAALQRVVAEYDLDALAINCHSDALRWNQQIGIVGCLGASLLTSAQCPVSCTGDAVTAISLCVATILAGHAQYCEGYFIGSQSGELLLSSCGMADLALRAPESRTVVALNKLYPGHGGLGCLCRHRFPPGPATIIGFSPGADGTDPALTWASGDLTERQFNRLNGPSGSFLFASGDGEAAIQHWIEAAPAHHMALTKGRLDLEFQVADRLVDFRIVSV